MGEFFKGWRRKVGVVTLMLACVFAGGWVRSCFVFDELRGRFDPENMHIELLISMNQQFGLLIFSNGIPQTTNPRFTWSVFSTKSIKSYWGETLEWWWHWHGFGVIEIRDRMTGPITPMMGELSHRGWVCPYWSVVIPLTLLSAWLLLSKPRKYEKPAVSPT